MSQQDNNNVQFFLFDNKNTYRTILPISHLQLALDNTNYENDMVSSSLHNNDHTKI